MRSDRDGLRSRLRGAFRDGAEGVGGSVFAQVGVAQDGGGDAVGAGPESGERLAPRARVTRPEAGQQRVFG